MPRIEVAVQLEKSIGAPMLSGSQNMEGVANEFLETLLEGLVMKSLVLIGLLGVVFIVLVAGMVWAVRSAKRASPAVTGLMASALLLFFGVGVVAEPPQQQIARAKEDQESEREDHSGDPL